MADLMPRFYALSESRGLGVATCSQAGLELGSIEERVFEGGEFKLRLLESARGRVAYILQSLAGTPELSLADSFVRLLFLLSTLRDTGATERVAILPYLAYARKERRTQLRDPVNTRYVAQLLEAAGADRVITLDVHNPASLDNAFRIPVDHLTALPMMAAHIVARLPGAALTVVSPDVGGIKRAQLFQELLERKLGRPVELAFLEKRRAAGNVNTGRLTGDVFGRVALLIDDLCATGGTLIRAADKCHEAGALAVHVAVTHAPLPAGIQAVAADKSIAEILVTDSCGRVDRAVSGGSKVCTLPVAPLFGRTLKRILSGQPVAPLLTDWPATD